MDDLVAQVIMWDSPLLFPSICWFGWNLKLRSLPASELAKVIEGIKVGRKE